MNTSSVVDDQDSQDLVGRSVLPALTWRRVAYPSCVLSLVALSTAIQLSFVRREVNGEMYAFRQSQTAMVVREFMRHGFDLRTPLPVFGTHSYAPFEMPLFQEFAALLGRVLDLQPVTATRLAGIICFQLTAVVLALLARRWFCAKTSLAALILFQWLPFGFQWGHAALIEFAPVLMMLSAVLLLTTGWIDSGDKRAVALKIVVILLVSTGFLIKPTTGIVLVPVLFVPAIDAMRKQAFARSSWRLLTTPAIALTTAVIVTQVWTSWADSVKSESRWTSPLTSSALKQWNFGTLHQRTSLGTWVTILNHYWAVIVGGAAGFALFSVIAVICWRWSTAVIVLSLTPLLGPLFFINLYTVHSYYSCAIYAALVLVAAAAIVGLSNRFGEFRDRIAIITVGVVLLLFTAWTSSEGALYRSEMALQFGVPALSTSISQTVAPDAQVFVVGCDWDPTIPYYADRRALMYTGWRGMIPSQDDLAPVTHVAFCTGTDQEQQQELKRLLPSTYQATRTSPGIYVLKKTP
jgi:4-amino-4-deoxy-L-arabinose transferase-like glycosyltransferase